MAIGDLNGDGKPDLAVANEGSDTVSVLLNTTATGVDHAVVRRPVHLRRGSDPTSVAIGDLNGDGKPDLAVANSGRHRVGAAEHDGDGGDHAVFAAQANFAVGSDPFSVAIGDLNGDGKPDLAVANCGSGTVSVLLNTSLTGVDPRHVRRPGRPSPSGRIPIPWRSAT